MATWLIALWMHGCISCILLCLSWCMECVPAFAFAIAFALDLAFAVAVNAMTDPCNT